jgi:ATP-dependent HslUV protease ATP-binding subunit HslU
MKIMIQLTPKEIMSELNKHIIGHEEAKKIVAIALRNRWRRMNIKGAIKEEVLPKNILMIGPTGVGKTEIARRLAKLSNSPFVKVEATKYTEIGYVGRDVEQMVRDLIDQAVIHEKNIMKKVNLLKAEEYALERIITSLVGDKASDETRQSYKQKVTSGILDDKEIEIEVLDNASAMQSIDIPGMPNSSMLNIGDIFGKAFGEKTKTRKTTVKEAIKILCLEESEKLVDNESAIDIAKQAVENNGIIFIDEIDKICARSEKAGSDVSREGVQRDLLPLIEGTTVSTKYGPIKTDHILFITSGAFHLSKPSDLLPELQGRLPTRVELKPLTQKDFVRILTETEHNLTKQYKAMMETENFIIEFSECAIEEIARLATELNSSMENIGARRLHTILEKALEEISFTASERSGESFIIDAKYINENVGKLAMNIDLSKFIL